MKNLLLVFILLSGLTFYGQEGQHGSIKVRKTIPVKDYVDIDFIPEYNFGILTKVIKGSMKYPKEAEKAGEQGTVGVLVVIDSGGNIVWHQVQANEFQHLNKEAARIISNLATFKPVIKDNVPVAVRTTIPVEFILE